MVSGWVGEGREREREKTNVLFKGVGSEEEDLIIETLHR